MCRALVLRLAGGFACRFTYPAGFLRPVRVSYWPAMCVPPVVLGDGLADDKKQ